MKLNLLSLIGVILIGAGIAFLLGVGIPGQETVLEVGGLEASMETERAVHPAIAGGIAVLGLAALVFGQKG